MILTFEQGESGCQLSRTKVIFWFQSYFRDANTDTQTHAHSTAPSGTSKVVGKKTKRRNRIS